MDFGWGRWVQAGRKPLVMDIAFDAMKTSVYSSSDHSLLDKWCSHTDSDNMTTLKSK